MNSSMTASSATLSRFPVRETAVLLAELARRQDEGEPLTDIFIEVFASAATDHVRAVDQARTLATFLDSRVAMAKQARDYWAAKAKADSDALEVLKEVCRVTMEQHPDLPWRDSQKQKLSLCKNSQASLTTDYDARLVNKTVYNVLSEDDRAALPERYVAVSPTYFVLNTAAIREDIAAGKEIPWAKLERGSHVRGLVMKQEALNDG